ncbi:MAG: GTPase ObgE [candidate division WOR-3 bacterium]|nr:GTPase ObgE [candidate division WOR-3 bacterium]MDH5684107.1 GTPase ObgE [candidate division WOR-3 bacterium]
MKFIDEAIIYVEAGAGGNGCLSFRREKFVPKGGPDGGDGGNGGSIFLIGDAKLETLADLAYRRHYRAKPGRHGMGKNMHGVKGDELLISVPLGTDINDAQTKRYIGEIVAENKKVLVVRGGKGGRGNASFKTSTNTTPTIRELGKEGQKRKLHLVLRLLADVGLVGLPNAGKSTLLKQLTAAHPKIASYPFTTLSPNLGVVKDQYISYTVADLPGIIEDAHKGKGLGLTFLRHIERAGLLVFLIDISQPNPLADYETLINEISSYNPEILKKQQVLVFNKIDLCSGEIPSFKVDKPTYYVSALTGEGVKEFIKGLKKQLGV